jgi:hypothetical protein
LTEALEAVDQGVFDRTSYLVWMQGIARRGYLKNPRGDLEDEADLLVVWETANFPNVPFLETCVPGVGRVSGQDGV